MKSISDTFETIHAIISALPGEVKAAIVGGYAAILHGLERTTLDVDICLYSGISHERVSDETFGLLKAHLPERFRAELVRGTLVPDDPFQHDLIVIDDRQGDFPRIDLILARYRWELEAIQEAQVMAGIPLPVVSRPHLVAMKLRSTGLKDESDVVGLMGLMDDEERIKACELARRVGRARKLSRLLTRLPEEAEEIPDEFIA